MLHSSFWHHGASDLSLPIWWAATSILESATGDFGDRAANKKTSTSHHGALLDFLYPEKTLALLRQLSVTRRDDLDPRRRQLQGAGLRRFSTVRALRQFDGNSVDVARIEEAREEMGRLLRGSGAMEELKKVLRSAEPGKQELAWQLYAAIPEHDLAEQDDLRRRLLRYSVQDGEFISANPSRVLHVFDELTSAARRASSYRAAISAYIALGQVGPAIKLLEEIDLTKGYDMLHVGTDVVLRNTVSEEQWDLSLRVFRTFLRQMPTRHKKPTAVAIRFGDTLPEIWSEAAQLPELVEHLEAFLNHVRTSQDEFASSPELKRGLSCFIMTFVPHVMDKVLNAKDPDENLIWDYFLELFDQLQSLERLPHSAVSTCYEFAIKRMLELPRYQEYTNQRKIWLELYRRYRQRHSDHGMDRLDSKPSQNLIRNLIFQNTLTGSLKRVNNYVQDLRTLYPDRPLRPGLLKHLIQAYAIAGDVDMVRNYIDELRSNYEQEVNLKVLSSMLYVYARRADVEGTIAQFKRIHEDFGFVPDTACWNTLLLAYCRADDLDGALECFNNFMDYGVVPDIETFGPLLDFCASRGDVEAFEALFSKAKSMGVEVDGDVRARSGYVRAFLNSGDAEGADAIAIGMLNSWRAGTLYGHPLTHTWNLLIQHRALNQDLAGSRECYRQMVQNNIPLDSWTYGSLMRALIEAKQTNAAYKLLRITMPQNGFQVHALHYAIVMTGFLKEDQVPQAMEAYERMIKRQVPQTESSRLAALETLGTDDLQILKKRKAKDPNYRLLKVEEALEDMLVSSTAAEIAHRQPRHRTSMDAHNFGAVPQSYYGLMISLYSSRRAYKICQKLFKKAAELAPDSENYIVPLTLITAMMEAHLKAGKYEEVANSWSLARDSATKLTKTFQQLVSPPPSDTESISLVDPIVQQRFQESRISNNRRHLLAKPARLYIRSLLKQATPETLTEAQTTLRDLLIHGFTVDNFTWNEFIQRLTRSNRLADAFATCEEYLMPRFPGWRNLAPGYHRHDRSGYQWMELRHTDIDQSSVMPRYKTLVLLAKAYAQVRMDERNGFGFDGERGLWTREILEQSAPLTVRALESMPRTADTLQERYFHNAV
jgi:pentatricopeptide repeat-containing protein PET309